MDRIVFEAVPSVDGGPGSVKVSVGGWRPLETLVTSPAAAGGMTFHLSLDEAERTRDELLRAIAALKGDGP
jgi:hypothetical protein